MRSASHVLASADAFGVVLTWGGWRSVNRSMRCRVWQQPWSGTSMFESDWRAAARRARLGVGLALGARVGGAMWLGCSLHRGGRGGLFLEGWRERLLSAWYFGQVDEAVPAP